MKNFVGRDRQYAVVLSDIVEPSPGPPFEPLVCADEATVAIAYFISPRAAEELQLTWPMTAVAVFHRALAHSFGPPNDEALDGHPLYGCGLQHYAFHEVSNSAWIARLRRQNRVHPRHSDCLFDGCRHFIATFKERTLEVVARGYVNWIDRDAYQWAAPAAVGEKNWSRNSSP